MTAFTKISSKGQVVIPKQVREGRHWPAGTELEVVERPDGILLRPIQPARQTISLETFFARVPPHEGPPKSLDEISRLSDEALRRAIDDGES